MKIAKVTLKSTSPYSQSRHYDEQDAPKKAKERHDEYEKRTWMHRMHTNEKGFVEIPGTSFANCIKTSCKRLRLQIPGKGKSEYTKHFEAGIMVPDVLTLKTKAADVQPDRLFVPSDGKRGGGKRVMKYFPRIDSWEGVVTVYVLDDLITEDVFTQVLKNAGMLVGIGRFRPESSGFYGRFSVEKVEWTDDAAVSMAA